ncbi:MAG: radical SAM protein [Candidatus Woesearchaeota archaeon]
MPVVGRNDVTKIIIEPELELLLKQASKIHEQSFGKTAWLGRCIFLSWYCGIGTCTFCFRSTQKHKIKFPEQGRRTKESIYTEALIAKSQGWKLEFLTGGHDMYPDFEILEIAKVCSEIFEEKIWLNIGAMNEEELKKFLPYVEGVVASLETTNKKLHDVVCPDKPMEPYFEMLIVAKKLNVKRSITIVLGLGETIEDYESLKEVIKKYDVNRITIYSLRPVKGTIFTQGPSSEYVALWIAKTRIDFPTLEIIAGSSETRIAELGLLLRSGANALTKLPATKIFGTTGAQDIHNQVLMAGREFSSDLVKLQNNNLDFKDQLDKTTLSSDMKDKILEKIKDYQKNRLNKSYKSFELVK